MALNTSILAGFLSVVAGFWLAFLIRSRLGDAREDKASRREEADARKDALMEALAVLHGLKDALQEALKDGESQGTAFQGVKDKVDAFVKFYIGHYVVIAGTPVYGMMEAFKNACTRLVSGDIGGSETVKMMGRCLELADGLLADLAFSITADDPDYKKG